MLIIEMGFPTGRYHATPWDKHVNEGGVEWPPSPWRLLRALIATWHTKGSGVSHEAMCSIVDKLMAAPEFHLPPVQIASTCHFMPLYRSSIDGKTANIYDAFAHIGDAKVRIIWRNVELSDQERVVLDILLSRMGYLGRAESWVDARVIGSEDVSANCRPITMAPPGHGDRVATLCCLSQHDYSVWREGIIETLRAQKEREKKERAESSGRGFRGLTTKEINDIAASVPIDLIEALQVDTSDMRSSGWPRPPGSIWVDYTLPTNAFRISQTGGKVTRTDLPTIARYTIRAKVPWTIFDAVTIGEMIHRRLVGISGQSPTFTGCDESRRPLRTDQTMILSHGVGRNIQGMRVTDVTIYNKNGFDERDEAALRSLHGFDYFGEEKRNGIQNEVVLIGIGQPETFGEEEGVISRSSHWTSITPFVPTRCPKYTRAGAPKLDEDGLHIGSAEHELRRLLKREGYPYVKHIEMIPRATVGGSNRSWLSFKRERASKDRKPINNAGFGFRIEFVEPFEGPFAIGYGRNFGLGLFRPG